MPPTSTPPPQYLPISAEWCLAAVARAPACIQLEVARTPQQQSWGLMGRPPLAPLRGMWFPYAQPQTLKFWMHRTPAPLDMLFLRQGSRRQGGVWASMATTWPPRTNSMSRGSGVRCIQKRASEGWL